MTVTVVCTPLELEPVVSAFLSSTRRAIGIDRVYRIYRSTAPLNLHDDDGSTLIEARLFANPATAYDWIAEDDRQRRLLHTGEVHA